jgi:hypothetical protein
VGYERTISPLRYFRFETRKSCGGRRELAVRRRPTTARQDGNPPSSDFRLRVASTRQDGATRWHMANVVEVSQVRHILLRARLRRTGNSYEWTETHALSHPKSEGNTRDSRNSQDLQRFLPVAQLGAPTPKEASVVAKAMGASRRTGQHGSYESYESSRNLNAVFSEAGETAQGRKGRGTGSKWMVQGPRSSDSGGEIKPN